MTDKYMQRADNAHLALLADRGYTPAKTEMQRRGLDASEQGKARRNAKRSERLAQYFADKPEAAAFHQQVMARIQSRTVVGQRVRKGQIQDIRVEYDDKGRSTVTPLGPWRQVAAHPQPKASA